MAQLTSVGFRVTPAKIFFSVVEVDQEHFSDLGDSTKEVHSIIYRRRTGDKDGIIYIPTILDPSHQYSFIRTAVQGLLEDYKPISSGFKAIEGNAKLRRNSRLVFEAIVTEAVMQTAVKKYLTGTYTTIGTYLRPKLTSQEVKTLVEKGKHPNFNDLPEHEEEREAMLTAIAALGAPCLI